MKRLLSTTQILLFVLVSSEAVAHDGLHTFASLHYQSLHIPVLPFFLLLMLAVLGGLIKIRGASKTK